MRSKPAKWALDLLSGTSQAKLPDLIEVADEVEDDDEIPAAQSTADEIPAAQSEPAPAGYY